MFKCIPSHCLFYYCPSSQSYPKQPHRNSSSLTMATTPRGLNFLSISMILATASMLILALMIRFSLPTLWTCLRWAGRVLILMQVLIDYPVFSSCEKDKLIWTMLLENKIKWWNFMKFSSMIALQQSAIKLRILYRKLKKCQNKSWCHL